MDRDNLFFETFLKPADLYRWGTERFSLPRLKKTIYRVNTEDDISRGYKFGTYAPTYPLQRLDAFGWSNGKRTGTAYNVLRNSINRKDKSKVGKKWIFTTYPETSSVSILQFDLDRHYESGMTPAEKKEVDYIFHQQVQLIQELAIDVECDVVWTTSPGDIFDRKWNEETLHWEDGEHVQGLYAWIKLEKPVQVRKLRKYVKALKDYYGLECESSVDSRNRLIRLPGQRYVEVADPKSVSILHEEKKPAMTLARFAEAWFNAKPANLKKLFGPAWNWLNKQEQKVVKPASHPKGLVKEVTVVGCAKDQALDEHNTFVAATSRRICSRLVIKYQGNRFFFDQAVLKKQNSSLY